jgi:hypothetical protein
MTALLIFALVGLFISVCAIIGLSLNRPYDE